MRPNTAWKTWKPCKKAFRKSPKSSSSPVPRSTARPSRLEPKVPADELDQFSRLHRLDEIIQDLQLLGFEKRVRAALGGEKDHGDLLGGGVFAQLLEHLPAAQHRHHHIEQDQVGFDALGL